MAASRPTADAQRVRRALAMVAVAGLVAAAVLFAVMREEPAGGPTVDEKIAILRTERVQPAARADSEARLTLLPLSVPPACCSMPCWCVRTRRRSRLRPPASLPAPRFRRTRRAEWRAQGRPGHAERGRTACRPQGRSPCGNAIRLAGGRRCAAHPVLFAALRAAAPCHRRTDAGAQPPNVAPGPAPQGALRLDTLGGPAANQAVQAAALRAGFRRGRRRRSAADRDRRVASGICRRAATGAVDRCVAGAGDGVARAAALGAARGLRDARRASFAAAALSIRRGSRTVLFQLLFTVLPDRPGSFAFDQLVRATTQESNTLVSPEILSRARGRDPHGPPLLRSAGRLALRQGASARGHRRAPGLAG